MIFKEYLTVDEAEIYLSNKTSLLVTFEDLQQLERAEKINPIVYLSEILFSDILFDTEIEVKTPLSGYFDTKGFVLLDRFRANPYREYQSQYYEIKDYDSFQVLKITESINDAPKFGTSGHFVTVDYREQGTTYNQVDEIPIQNVFIKKYELDACISESLNPPTLVIDTYGRKYDINQHKQNREDSYLTADEAFRYINRQAGLSFLDTIDKTKLKDLARKKEVIPCFYFSGYVGQLSSYGDSNGLYTELVSGYFTFRGLIEEIDKDERDIKLPSCQLEDGIMIYRILDKKTAEFNDYDDGVFLFISKPQDLNSADDVELKFICTSEIRFSKSMLDSYIKSIAVMNESLQTKKQSEYTDEKTNIINDLTKKVEELESKLKQAKAELAGKPADSITQSNTDIHNIKKEAIKQFNRSLATVLIELDYKGKLRKGDIANYIVPYMKELAFVLADKQQDKADNLTVTYDTLYDNHLKNLGFKQGRQSDDEKQKVNIDLLFKKQLPITE